MNMKQKILIIFVIIISDPIFIAIDYCHEIIVRNEVGTVVKAPISGCLKHIYAYPDKKLNKGATIAFIDNDIRESLSKNRVTVKYDCKVVSVLRESNSYIKEGETIAIIEPQKNVKDLIITSVKRTFITCFICVIGYFIFKTISIYVKLTSKISSQKINGPYLTKEQIKNFCKEEELLAKDTLKLKELQTIENRAKLKFEKNPNIISYLERQIPSEHSVNAVKYTLELATSGNYSEENFREIIKTHWNRPSKRYSMTFKILDEIVPFPFECSTRLKKLYLDSPTLCKAILNIVLAIPFGIMWYYTKYTGNVILDGGGVWWFLYSSAFVWFFHASLYYLIRTLIESSISIDRKKYNTYYEYVNSPEYETVIKAAPSWGLFIYGLISGLEIPCWYLSQPLGGIFFGAFVYSWTSIPLTIIFCLIGEKSKKNYFNRYKYLTNTDPYECGDYIGAATFSVITNATGKLFSKFL